MYWISGYRRDGILHPNSVGEPENITYFVFNGSFKIFSIPSFTREANSSAGKALYTDWTYEYTDVAEFHKLN